jgi:hypothetical protein
MAEKTPVEAPEAPVEAIETPEAPVAPTEVPKGFVAVLDGDNYQTIAERVGKVTAEELHTLNNELPLYPGMKIRVK